MISSMVSWGSESMARDRLVVPGDWGEDDSTKPGSAKMVCFYSLSARALMAAVRTPTKIRA